MYTESCCLLEEALDYIVVHFYEYHNIIFLYRKYYQLEAELWLDKQDDPRGKEDRDDDEHLDREIDKNVFL